MGLYAFSHIKNTSPGIDIVAVWSSRMRLLENSLAILLTECQGQQTQQLMIKGIVWGMHKSPVGCEKAKAQLPGSMHNYQGINQNKKCYVSIW